MCSFAGHRGRTRRRRSAGAARQRDRARRAAGGRGDGCRGRDHGRTDVRDRRTLVDPRRAGSGRLRTGAAAAGGTCQLTGWPPNDEVPASGSSWSTGSRRPADPGGRSRTSCAARTRSSPSMHPGTANPPPSPPTSATARRCSERPVDRRPTSAIRWAGGCACRLALDSRISSSGSCWSARRPASQMRRNAPPGAADETVGGGDRAGRRRPIPPVLDRAAAVRHARRAGPRRPPAQHSDGLMSSLRMAGTGAEPALWERSVSCRCRCS